MTTDQLQANSIILKPCEIESCPRVSATLCHHCIKNVCRRHFDEHAEELVQELHSQANSINELGEKISSLSVEEYKRKPLEKLIQWRDEAVRHINDVYELKKTKLDLLLQDNEELFLQRVTCHTKVLDELKEETATLAKDGDVTFEQLQLVKRTFRELEENVNRTQTSIVYCDTKPLLCDDNAVLFNSAVLNYMQGGTLLCADYQMRLNDFYGNPVQKWELIYKATKDGFRAEDFHRCSDNKGPTMTIIQAKIGDYLFGGYTELSWGCDGKYKFDPAAFLFTLKNPHGIQPTKFLRNASQENSVGHAKHVGPYFGGVVKDQKHFMDIEISTNSNMNENSSSSFPSTYTDTTGKGETLFGGKKNFKVKEIEVYKRVDEIRKNEDANGN